MKKLKHSICFQFLLTPGMLSFRISTIIENKFNDLKKLVIHVKSISYILVFIETIRTLEIKEKFLSARLLTP